MPLILRIQVLPQDLLEDCFWDRLAFPVRAQLPMSCKIAIVFPTTTDGKDALHSEGHPI